MVAVFREVRRVLRSDGTLWLNYGDSYAHDGCGPQGDSPAARPKNRAQRDNDKRRRNNHGLKPKDLVGMPWRVAFALQADGWWLRSDIIWHKPNPMPESVTDRPTSAHEYLFLLAKSARYFYDADAIRERMTGHTRLIDGVKVSGEGGLSKRSGMKHRFIGNQATGPDAKINPAGRNKRTVWTVATQPYSGAHFATFPPKLITPCILAGTSERGCCSECGAPWVRVVVASGGDIGKTGKAWNVENDRGTNTKRGAGSTKDYRRTTTGWRPTCDHDAEVVPCTVLDPFGGSGTTAEVAEALGRRWVLIELNPDYEPLIRRRTAQLGLFGTDRRRVAPAASAV
jgi:DNA modification methylase